MELSSEWAAVTLMQLSTIWKLTNMSQCPRCAALTSILEHGISVVLVLVYAVHDICPLLQ